ncbi:DUF4261 domain-containing protein [Pseudobacteroides cellulosolvens]|uniref:DUF4261 domain-containing protein n=1 Tax=Pseudobacteroides cellulosolvens ATCC 35603 = DSM 2933 TaxID=398512 RepID=A0A0L6JWZ3_9FIRM|nr:DUF4261 domain-containing protein [Pseudobacteroides cellulosolvens]KNY29962.1 protein of unknown function DUF4261 [Pseudobacteroides cellulosolvens ATCC 35603 = DSM 2933]
MPKGLFSQGMVVLLSEPVLFSKLEQIFAEDFKLVAKNENSEQWYFGGPSVLISYRPEVNGYITVDVVDKPWPDHMGDPEKEEMLFGAWSMGYFGPFTYPGSLSHSAQQSWLYEDGSKNAAEHKAFIRIRSSYVLGSNVDKDTPVLPKNYDPGHEMMFLTKVCQNVLQMSEALCYFNPNGECLASDEIVDGLLERYEKMGMYPLEIWSNIRLFNFPDSDKWALMDTVGMGQLDTIDHEAIFIKGEFDPNDIVNFFRNTEVFYLNNRGLVFKNGQIVVGPGGVCWQGVAIKESIAAPPRSVIRWFPADGSERPEAYLGGLPNYVNKSVDDLDEAEEEEEDDEGKYEFEHKVEINEDEYDNGENDKDKDEYEEYEADSQDIEEKEVNEVKADKEDKKKEEIEDNEGKEKKGFFKRIFGK